VDHKKRFVDLVVGWPGSVNDHRIWVNSQLHHDLEERLRDLPTTRISTIVDGESRLEEVPAFILADSAYPNTSHVVPTYRVTECNNCPITKALNKKLSGVRYHVENAFGICKGRFRILNRPMECASEDIMRAIILISATFTLHNFLIDEKDQSVIEPIARQSNETIEGDDHEYRQVAMVNNETRTRDILWRHIAWTKTDAESD
jgi:hypothetical protein